MLRVSFQSYATNRSGIRQIFWYSNTQSAILGTMQERERAQNGYSMYILIMISCDELCLSGHFIWNMQSFYQSVSYSYLHMILRQESYYIGIRSDYTRVTSVRLFRYSAHDAIARLVMIFGSRNRAWQHFHDPVRDLYTTDTVGTVQLHLHDYTIRSNESGDTLTMAISTTPLRSDFCISYSAERFHWLWYCKSYPVVHTEMKLLRLW